MDILRVSATHETEQVEAAGSSSGRDTKSMGNSLFYEDLKTSNVPAEEEPEISGAKTKEQSEKPQQKEDDPEDTADTVEKKERSEINVAAADDDGEDEVESKSTAVTTASREIAAVSGTAVTLSVSRPKNGKGDEDEEFYAPIRIPPSKQKRLAAKSVLHNSFSLPKRAKTEVGVAGAENPSSAAAAEPSRQKAEKATPAKKPKTPAAGSGTKMRDICVYSGEPTRKLNKGTWPEGWTERQYQRREGATSGRVDFYFYPPADDGKVYKLRSIAEVERYIAAFNETGSHQKAFAARKKG